MEAIIVVFLAVFSDRSRTDSRIAAASLNFEKLKRRKKHWLPMVLAIISIALEKICLIMKKLYERGRLEAWHSWLLSGLVWRNALAGLAFIKNLISSDPKITPPWL